VAVVRYRQRDRTSFDSSLGGRNRIVGLGKRTLATVSSRGRVRPIACGQQKRKPAEKADWLIQSISTLAPSISHRA
jgi:hypothetical protein